MEEDKRIKAIKKERFEAQKESNNAAAVITNKQIKQLTLQIKSLQLRLKTKHKTNSKKSSKNSDGPTGKKKTEKPRATKEGRKPNKSKGNGNSKGMSKDRQ